MSERRTRPSDVRQFGDSTIYSPEREILSRATVDVPVLRSDEAGIRDIINHLAEINLRKAEITELDENPEEYADRLGAISSDIQSSLTEAIGSPFCKENPELMLAIVELKSSIETLASMTLKAVTESGDRLNMKATIGYSTVKELPASINSITWDVSNLPDRISDGGVEQDVRSSVLENVSAKVDNNWRTVQGCIEAMNRVTGV